MQLPTLIHQIWLGPQPVSDTDREYAATLRACNPDWKLVLHTERPEEYGADDPWNQVLPLPTPHHKWVVEAIYDRITDPERRGWMYAMLSDVLRIDALIEYGGVYLDTDVFGVRPLFHAIKPDTRLAISNEFARKMVGNFFLAATPGHRALWLCLSRYEREFQQRTEAPESKMNPVGITGPIPTSEVFTDDCDCTIYPWPVFSPWSPDYHMRDDWREIAWPKATVCVHACGSRWTQRKRSRAEDASDAMQPTWKPPLHKMRTRKGVCC